MSKNWKYKFLPKDRGVPHQKSVEVTKSKNCCTLLALPISPDVMDGF